MPNRTQQASPESLLGQLQRGRGEAYLRILSAPRHEAHGLLLECITQDPRWDRQIEERAAYYAAIALVVKLDLTPLARHLRDNDDPDQSTSNTCLTVQTLGELAKRNDPNAARILCDYVTWGQWWAWPLDELITLPDPHLHKRIIAAIEARFPADGELETAFKYRYLDETTWLSLATNSQRIDKVRNRVQSEATPIQGPPSPNLSSLGLKQVLELAGKENRQVLRRFIGALVTPSDVDLLIENVSIAQPFISSVALAGLAHLAPEGIFPWLLNFWTSHPEMPCFLRNQTIQVMLSLPPVLTLPLARERLDHKCWHDRLLAEDLFTAHAREEDLPLLRSAITQALEDDDANCYRLCNLAEAVARFPGIGPVPELMQVFVQIRYSYGRILAAEAIQVTSPGLFRDTLAVECLWDCEDQTRLLGVKYSPAENPAATLRLQELAANVCEDDSVRAEAAKRIGAT